jgi:penicillin-binding protein 1A
MRKKSTYVIIAVLLAGALSGALGGAFLALTHDLPQIRSLENFQPASVTRVYSSDGVLLDELFVAKRHPVSIGSMPKCLIAAIITTEDRKFYRHSGVDLKGVARAVVKDILAGEFVEGASTITQQLAKTLFLTPRKTLVRKIREALLAFQLERRYTKDEILELYLNQIYFGSGAYGVEAAARVYFGKPVSDLSIEECALIAAMPRSPSRYSPRVNPALAVERRNIVLKLMHAVGQLTDQQYLAAVRTGLDLAPGVENQARAPYFVAYVKQILEREIGATRLYRDGLEIRTTLNYTLQTAAEKAVADGLASLELRMMKNGIAMPDPQAALVATSVSDSAILAMVGGRDFGKSVFNRATDALRQPGSAFKPLVFGCAVENGYPQNSLILDAPVVYKGAGNDHQWQPQNFSRGFEGEITLRRALAVSQNIPAVRLAEKLGPQAIVTFSRRMGITSPLSGDLSLALGSSEVRLIELVNAYAVFANRGQRVSPAAISEILDRHGRVIWQPKRRRQTAMSPASAAIVTDMLTAVIKEGTGKKAAVVGASVAGKTGTTNNTRDALFVGYSPNVAAGVWVGEDAGNSLGAGETGAAAALPIWIDFMKAALAQAPADRFDMPDTVTAKSIDPVKGTPLGPDHPDAVVALFKKN